MRKLVTPRFFKNAVFRDASGRRLRLQRVAAEPGGKQRPVRLMLFTAGEGTDSLAGTIELTRREAYALSEWLDELVTGQERSVD